MTTDANERLLTNLLSLIQSYMAEAEERQTGRDRMVAILAPALSAVLEGDAAGAREYLWQAVDQLTRWERHEAEDRARRGLLEKFVDELRIRRGLMGIAVLASMKMPGEGWRLAKATVAQGWHVFAKGGGLRDGDLQLLEQMLIQGPFGESGIVVEESRRRE